MIEGLESKVRNVQTIPFDNITSRTNLNDFLERQIFSTYCIKEQYFYIQGCSSNFTLFNTCDILSLPSIYE